MPWPDVLGHDKIWDRFCSAAKQGRLASAFLFIGLPGIGKRTLALHMAQALLCEATPPDQMTACEKCAACRQVVSRTHPDLILVSKPGDKNFIPVETFIGDREHRMREGLCHDIALKPFRGGRRVAIIDDADYLNQEGANCLLKTLEEPPEGSVIILIGTSEQRQLPTIRSRCQIVRFAPLTNEQVAQLIERHQLIPDPQLAAAAASRSDGSIEQALTLADPALADAQRSLLGKLSCPDFDVLALIKEVGELVDAAGKEVPVRRVKMRRLVRAAAEFYRQLMRVTAGADASGDPLIDQFVTQASAHWQQREAVAADCLERCQEALAQIDANANLATLIAGWLDDLAQQSLTPS